MSDFALISQAIPQVFTLYNMLLIFGGLVLGMVIGCVPGLSVTLGIILMLPLTYTFDDPASAIILLLAVYVGGMYGGSISAILIHAPGTPAAAATLLDGYPMCKKGQAGKALSVAMFASFCLHYAGIPESAFPYEAGCTRWVELLTQAGLYTTGAPERGVLVFFDKNADGLADHVGIVTAVSDDGFQTIEGNLGKAVVSQTHSYADGEVSLRRRVSGVDRLKIVPVQELTGARRGRQGV